MNDELAKALASLSPPPDLILDALRVAMAKFPQEDTPVLAYLDRLEELGCRHLGVFERFDLALRQLQRTTLEVIVKAFGIPAELLGDNSSSGR